MNKKNIIAIIYDFDGTLSPQPMQEYTVFPQLKISPNTFWREVRKENERIKGEEIITYMMKMLKKADEKTDLKISKADLGRMADKIRYFPGVVPYFDRINRFVEKESKGRVKLRHYIISSGLKEILDKIKIEGHFHNIFASEYYYNAYDKPCYPKLVVTDTVKTQFLFRINKGREKLTENINEFMDEEERPIPFSNIIYIGDGLTDVPCMTVTTKNGGYSIAVFNPKKRKSVGICKTLFKNARVDFIAEADYCNGRELDTYIKVILKTIIAGINHYNAQRDMVRKRNMYR
jgi:haloacid dehalogenase-like hydrolase